jgi:hypothetical protein
MVIRSRLIASLAIVAALVLAAPSLRAQPRVPGDAAVDRALEEMLGDIDAEDEDAPDAEELLWLHEHPIDLRAAEAGELARLPGIDPQIAIAIVDVVAHLQPIDLAALAASMQLSQKELLSLRAFTTLAVDRARDELHGSARLRIERDLVERRGHRDRLLRVVRLPDDTLDTIDVGTPYRGAPEALVAQLRLERGPLGIAATVGSDRGEPLWTRDTLAYRYAQLESVSDSAPLTTRSRLTSFVGGCLAWQSPAVTAVLGDYTAEFGQGLALSDGRRRFSRSAGAAAPYVAARRIGPSRSSDETSFFRGAAAEATIERPLPFRARVAAIASWRWHDGTMDSILDDADRTRMLVSSLRSDGNHRTTSEIRRSGNALRTLTALNATIESERWSVGATWARSLLRADGADTSLTHRSWGVDGRISSRRATAYAEVAGGDGSLAAVAGLFYRSGSMTALLAARHLPVGTDLPHGRAFPQSSEPAPERGLFMAIETGFSAGLRLSMSLDIFRRPLPSSTVPFPRTGSDGRARLSWSLGRSIDVELRAERSRDLDGIPHTDAVGRAVRGIATVDRTRLGATLAHEPIARALTIRLRLDWRHLDRSSDSVAASGWLTSVDVAARLSRAFELRAALALFVASDADVAQYLGESDLPGRVRSVRLGGVGSRASVSLRWEPLPRVKLSLAWAETTTLDRRAVGSGLDEIDGNRLPSVAFQIDVSTAR